MATKATPAPAVHTAGPYRNNAQWATAHSAAKVAGRGNPVYMQAVTVVTHLGWRAPGGTTSWHAGTNATAMGHIKAMGMATAGLPIAACMAKAVAQMVASATTPQQTQAAKALQAMLPAAK